MLRTARHVERVGLRGARECCMPSPGSTGKSRCCPFCSAGPPNGPLALRVSTTRQGVSGKNANAELSWTKYPLMSSTTSVVLLAYTLTACEVPAGDDRGVRLDAPVQRVQSRHDRPGRSRRPDGQVGERPWERPSRSTHRHARLRECRNFPAGWRKSREVPPLIAGTAEGAVSIARVHHAARRDRHKAQRRRTFDDSNIVQIHGGEIAVAVSVFMHVEIQLHGLTLVRRQIEGDCRSRSGCWNATLTPGPACCRWYRESALPASRSRCCPRSTARTRSSALDSADWLGTVTV